VFRCRYTPAGEQAVSIQIMKKKILIIVLLVGLIGFNNYWWFGKYIDSSLSLDTEMSNHFYTKRSLEDFQRRIEKYYTKAC
jgi:hypothetical protein